MTNAMISKLVVGFASLGAIFGTVFLSPQATTPQTQHSATFVQNSSYTTIAKAPVAKALTINKVHIFQGEINRRGLAVGYHHRPNGKDSNNARMVKLTGLPNRQGIYIGRGEIRNPANCQWVSKLSSSTFFPDQWTQVQVLSEIQSAFASSNKSKEPWQGTAPSGLKIEGYYNKATNTITTAYPIYRR
ncbi:MAG: EndoU domain-containing protein [Pseudanabaena sp. LacPavin_0818_WC45_MAG_42_6]|nr:EndoU domain-containing protein [Pseudanabaena sp. LacPavin_0818_WC45_MAG_42_6]